MASFTAPNIETQQVVNGINYQLTIAEFDTGPGITRVEIGPYYFDTSVGQVKYPEAPTNEMCPSGWEQIRWVQESDGSCWLRYNGGIILAEDNERIFQFTSNFPPSTIGTAKLKIWRGTRTETFEANVPDYTCEPPARNSRRDSTGLGAVYNKWGCMPQVILCVSTLVAVISILK
jgi:hypothetical protein